MADRNAVFRSNISLLRCPLCKEEMFISENSLKCKKGHDFSLSRKGYCDLAPQKHTTLYTKELFECRRRILKSRLYGNAVNKLKELLNTFAPEGPVLDAGCGEGTFLLASAEDSRPCFGADLAREGIRLAASGGNGLGWFVADLARLPFKNETLSAVLNILSPAAYPEFRRVLKPDGVLIKVIPGDRYLSELRTLAGKSPHSNEKVLSLFKQQFSCLCLEETEDTFTITAEEAADLYRMTPLTEHTKTEHEAFEALRSVTVHLCYLVGKAN